MLQGVEELFDPVRGQHAELSKGEHQAGVPTEGCGSRKGVITKKSQRT
ncbi:hypothetical protein Actkin_01301 [Actinokineospora sp. UTMC 2448]|nr:hypothetical protein Actkin_01301 [Actinokineospora sp. UTMC 2448]